MFWSVYLLILLEWLKAFCKAQKVVVSFSWAVKQGLCASCRVCVCSVGLGTWCILSPFYRWEMGSEILSEFRQLLKNGIAMVWTQACSTPPNSVILNCFFSSEPKLIYEPSLFDLCPQSHSLAMSGTFLQMRKRRVSKKWVVPFHGPVKS